MEAEQLVIPVECPPQNRSEPGVLSKEDKRILENTFLRLAEMSHQLSGQAATDVLLLLTTCRNQQYTVNAMYVEARKWCAEGQNANYTGYGDALDQLESAVSVLRSGSSRLRPQMEKVFDKAAVTLSLAAAYLAEFRRKFELFFQRFAEVQSRLKDYGQSLMEKDPIAAYDVQETFIAEGNGPQGHELRPPSEPEKDVYCARLLNWIEVVRPLTGLTRTYLDEVLRNRHSHKKSSRDYLREMAEGARKWPCLGIECPSILDENSAFKPWPLAFNSSLEAFAAADQLSLFVEFCRQSLNCARRFLDDLVPGNESLLVRFPLRTLEERASVTIGTRTFRRKANMLVLIYDMRNSLGDRYQTPELKVKSDQVIEHLRKDTHACSQTTYDDCRVLACDSLKDMALCILRLFSFFQVERSSIGVAGIRMGCVQGEMLYNYDGPLSDLLKAAPLDSSENTIGRASRVMSLDSQRFKPEGEALVKALGDWSNNENLLFIDGSVFDELPDSVREMCRSLGVVPLKGVGKRGCWALPINSVKNLVNNVAAVDGSK